MTLVSVASVGESAEQNTPGPKQSDPYCGAFVLLLLAQALESRILRRTAYVAMPQFEICLQLLSMIGLLRTILPSGHLEHGPWTAWSLRTSMVSRFGCGDVPLDADIGL